MVLWSVRHTAVAVRNRGSSMVRRRQQSEAGMNASDVNAVRSVFGLFWFWRLSACLPLRCLAFFWLAFPALPRLGLPCRVFAFFCPGSNYLFH